MSDSATRTASGLPRPAAYLLAVAAGAILIDVVAAISGSYHWWANFILGAGGALLALGAPAHRVGRPAWFALTCVGAVVVLTGTLLTFDAMGAAWPLMISVPCLGVAATVALATRGRTDESARAIAQTVIGLAVLGAVLGGVLLLLANDVVEADGRRWWVVFMIAAGGIPVAAAVRLLIRRLGRYWLSVAVFLATPGIVTIYCGIRSIGGWG